MYKWKPRSTHTNTSTTRVQSNYSHGWRYIATNLRCLCVYMIKPQNVNRISNVSFFLLVLWFQTNFASLSLSLWWCYNIDAVIIAFYFVCLPLHFWKRANQLDQSKHWNFSNIDWLTNEPMRFHLFSRWSTKKNETNNFEHTYTHTHSRNTYYRLQKQNNNNWFSHTENIAVYHIHIYSVLNDNL